MSRPRHGVPASTCFDEPQLFQPAPVEVAVVLLEVSHPGPDDAQPIVFSRARQERWRGRRQRARPSKTGHEARHVVGATFGAGWRTPGRAVERRSATRRCSTLRGPPPPRRDGTTAATRALCGVSGTVTVMLHSFHDAGFPAPNILDEYKPALIRTRAADNRMWVVASNSSARHSSWATCVARPDGSIAASLRRHASGLLVHDFPDPRLRGWLHNRRPFRLHPRTLLHNGRPSRCPRARDGRAEP